MGTTLYIIICIALSVLILLGISMMSKVKTAKVGNLVSAASLLMGVIITLWHNEIISIVSIYVYILIGLIVGGFLAQRVKMIQMPQMVALLNGLGGFASALVGVLSLLGIGQTESKFPTFTNFTATLAIIIGLITLFGSLVAAGKLHKILPQKPVVWKKHTLILNTGILILFLTLLFTLFIEQFGDRELSIALILLIGIGISSLFGYAFAIRVGGADMPITISLLNSLSGVAGAIAGLAIGDILLVSVGGIVGASGLFLTQIMCQSMNRKLMDILAGKTSVSTSTQNTPKLENEEMKQKETEKLNVEEKNEEKTTKTAADYATILKTAKSVIIVPGYGMALAQAQHLVRQLADKLENNGAEVKYAIHPVAGRMPGHMNVLLAEADVPYEKLYEMDTINDDFSTTDVTIVVGANDVLNPSARDAVDTPIYGMPVLNVDKCNEIFICNFDLTPGYSGVENPLYKRNDGVHLFLGDAKESLEKLISFF